MTFKHLLLCVCAHALLVVSIASAEGKPALWLYYPTNLQVAENVEKAEALWTRAAAAGYSTVIITDSKLNHLGDVPDYYFKNVDRAKRIAAKLKLQLVPTLFPIGYSNGLLWHDPNLAEGLPVKDQSFVVRDGHLVAAPTGVPSLEKISFKDDDVEIKDGVATFHPGGDVARFVYQLKVAPYRCYHVSVKTRSNNLQGRPEIKALAGDWTLNWQYLHVEPTQDWTQQDIVFNSLDHDQVNLYFGMWSAVRGELQWKDWKIEESPLVNILRREGAPLVVKDESGKTLTEGQDFDRVVDPKMGMEPWGGEYRSWHEPPTVKTHLPDGTRFKISWFHPVIIYDGEVSACIAEPKTMQLCADQAQRVKKLFDVPLYMMEHDEFRTLGWDDACEKSHKTPGELLAENARECVKLISPRRAAVWNDMFDPFHNAVKGPYYLVNGPWTGSWEGLDKSVLIINWNYGKRDESLKFFADRGHEQVIAGFYDGPMSDWQNWLDSSKKVKGITGYMYTTWQNDYSKLEKFAEMAK